MTHKDALEIINQIRISNSFTMGLSVDEYVEQFKARWELMYDEKLVTEIDVVNAMLKC